MAEIERNKGIIEHETVATINKGYVSLPYSDEDFKSFISGLLGRGQEIEKTIRGRFDIGITQLMNVHTILNQRIRQQNKASLISFSARIFYSDESTVTLHSIEELQTYNEIRSVVCHSILLSWDYLIQFEDKDTPEKQQINVHLMTGQTVRFSNGKQRVLLANDSPGIVRISINHTARTWAVDIESILVSSFESLMDLNKTAKDFLKKNSAWLALLSGVISFMAIIIISILTTNEFSSRSIAEVHNALNATTLTTDDRINYISSYIAEGAWSRYTQKLVLFIIIGLIGSIILAVIIGFLLDELVTGNSFISINNATEKYKNELLKQASKDYYKLMGTIIISILCGIIANYIFKYLTI